MNGEKTKRLLKHRLTCGKYILAAGCMMLLTSAGSGHMENITGRPSMTAMYVESLKMDGRLSDPAWSVAPEYQLELAEGAYVNLAEKIRRTLGNELREKGAVKLLWNENYLYVGVRMEDSDVVAEGKEDQTHLYLTGDLIEVFLKPANETYYWELYGAPNGRKTSFFYPGRGRLFVPSCGEYKPSAEMTVIAAVDGRLNDWRDKDKGWSIEIAIPAKMLTEFGSRFDHTADWTILVARYNYSRFLSMKENSSAPRLSAPNNHLYEDYARLILNRTGSR